MPQHPSNLLLMPIILALVGSYKTLLTLRLLAKNRRLRSSSSIQSMPPHSPMRQKQSSGGSSLHSATCKQDALLTSRPPTAKLGSMARATSVVALEAALDTMLRTYDAKGGVYDDNVSDAATSNSQAQPASIPAPIGAIKPVTPVDLRLVAPLDIRFNGGPLASFYGSVSEMTPTRHIKFLTTRWR